MEKTTANEKRKWQIALRRYILEKKSSFEYAPYFGLSIEDMRNWIASQFEEGLNWENFSIQWQFDHILPLSCFDLKEEEEKRLCWNFTNISIHKTDKNNIQPTNLRAAKAYFKLIYEQTHYSISLKMLEKIEKLENGNVILPQKSLSFLQANKETMETLTSLGSYEFDKINHQTSLKEVLAEKALLDKYGK